MKTRSMKLVIILAGMIICCCGHVLAQKNEGKIAFYSERYGHADIYVINDDGTNLQRLTNNNSNDQTPDWSSDGTKIAFTSDRTGNKEIWVMDSDGSNPVQLTFTPENESQPDWSPDDNYIAFTRWSPGSWDDGDVYIMDPTGSNVVQLTVDPANDSRPTWYPDGDKILFNSTRDGNYEIYSMNPDGSDQLPLMSTSTDELFPSVSPNGLKVVYSLFDIPAFTAEIHVMNIDGSGDSLIANTGDVNEDAVWAHNGSKIVFQSDRTGDYEIYIMNSDGSAQTNLTNNPGGDYWPSWTSGSAVGIEGDDRDRQDQCRLKQNYPNPFTGKTTISFTLGKAALVSLQVYDLMGNEVLSLLEQSFFPAGEHSVEIDARTCNSGIYFYRLNSDDGFSHVRKMCLVK